MPETTSARTEIATSIDGITDTARNPKDRRPRHRVVLPPLTLPESGDGYLAERQVCAVLQVSRSTLWRWVRDGRLPRVRVGRMTRWRVRDVRGLL